MIYKSILYLLPILFLDFFNGACKSMAVMDQGVRSTESYTDKAVENDLDLDAAMMECNKTFVTEKSYLEALNESGTFPDETDRTPKCFIRCILQQTGVASAQEDSYDPMRAARVFQKLRPYHSMEDIDDSATKCLEREEVCKCERAYNFIRCLVEQDIEKHERPSSET